MAQSKTFKILYWVFTIPFLALMLFSAFNYLASNPQMVEGIKALGYPVYLLKILGVAKILGAIAILYGRFQTLKEWAYAGFVIDVIGAALSHHFNGDPIQKVLIPIVFLVIILISYFLWKKK